MVKKEIGFENGGQHGRKRQGIDGPTQPEIRDHPDVQPVAESKIPNFKE